MSAKTQATGARFLWAAGLTLGLVIAGLGAVAVYLNPWGNYGAAGFVFLYNARQAKAEYLSGLPREQLPQAVILGSSNVMRMKPATVSRLLGKSAFNFGVYWGRADDMLCISRFVVHDLKYRPDLLIVGLDTWTFAPRTTPHPVFPGIRRRLLNSRLAAHHPAVYEPALTWGRAVDIFSPEQVRHGLRARRGGRAERGPQAPLEETALLDIDGTRVSYGALYGPPGPIFEAVEQRRYPITQYLEEAAAQRKLVSLDQYRFDGLDEVRLQYFEALLDLADAEGIEVVLVLNPVHPVFTQALEGLSVHQENVRALKARAQSWRAAHLAVVGVVDTSRLEDFGGDPEGFYDEIHYDTANADLILRRVAEVIKKP